MRFVGGGMRISTPSDDSSTDDDKRGLYPSTVPTQKIAWRLRGLTV